MGCWWYGGFFLFVGETVLILVLLEDGLLVFFLFLCYKKLSVLILVLLEDGLLVYYYGKFSKNHCSLNPCFAGRWVAGIEKEFIEKQKNKVLILVLLEDGLLD